MYDTSLVVRNEFIEETIHTIVLCLGVWQAFSVKNQRVNTAGFAGHAVSVTTAPHNVVAQGQPKGMNGGGFTETHSNKVLLSKGFGMDLVCRP